MWVKFKLSCCYTATNQPSMHPNHVDIYSAVTTTAVLFIILVTLPPPIHQAILQIKLLPQILKAVVDIN